LYRRMFVFAFVLCILVPILFYEFCYIAISLVVLAPPESWTLGIPSLIFNFITIPAFRCASAIKRARRSPAVSSVCGLRWHRPARCSGLAVTPSRKARTRLLDLPAFP
jgi:hypothetical protein